MRNNPEVLDLYIDGNSAQEAEISAEELAKVLQQVSNTISTSIASLCAEMQIGIESTVPALENLSTGLVALVSELQRLVEVLQQGFEREQWEEWLSLGVESISVMVELYSIYQTLLALTGALTMAGHAHSVAWEVVNAVHTVSIALTNALSAAMAFLTSPIGLVVVAITALIAITVLLVKNWDTVKAAAVSVWETITATFSAAGAWFQQNVVAPVAGFFSGMWEGFRQAAVNAWEGVKAVFSTVAGFFGKIFSEAWAGVVKVFSTAGNIFADIKDGIVTVFKSVVNGLITGINAMKYHASWSREHLLCEG